MCCWLVTTGASTCCSLRTSCFHPGLALKWREARALEVCIKDEYVFFPISERIFVNHLCLFFELQRWRVMYMLFYKDKWYLLLRVVTILASVSLSFVLFFFIYGLHWLVIRQVPRNFLEACFAGNRHTDSYCRLPFMFFNFFFYIYKNLRVWYVSPFSGWSATNVLKNL